MNAPLRRGVCPTLAIPMQTGDGLLARLNPVASGVSPKALIGLCEAALHHGSGVVEITARGSLQIRGLTAKSAALLATEVDALGIDVRRGAPVETGPLAGLDPNEIADPRPLAEAIRAGITAAGLEKRLGPKVSVVVDGGGRSMLDDVSADVRLMAMSRDHGQVVWTLAIAGDAATATTLAEFMEEAACEATLTILGAIAALGRDGRARDLAREMSASALSGAAGSSPTLPPSVLPERGSMERHPSTGRAILGNVIHLLDGRLALPLALPFGHIHAAGLSAFIKRAEALGATEIRLAPRRSLFLLCPSEAAANAVADAACQADLIVDEGDPRSSIAACPGSPACASGQIPARVIAAELAAAMPAGIAVDLHVSGCEKRCAKPGHDGLTLLGLPDGAGLVAETAGKAPVASVAKGDAAAAFGRVARLLSEERTPDESEAACLARLGAARLAGAFAAREFVKAR